MVFSCLKRTAVTPLKTGKSPKGNSWTRTIDFQGQFIQFMEENSPRNDILTGPDGPRGMGKSLGWGFSSRKSKKFNLHLSYEYLG